MCGLIAYVLQLRQSLLSVTAQIPGALSKRLVDEVSQVQEIAAHVLNLVCNLMMLKCLYNERLDESP